MIYPTMKLHLALYFGFFALSHGSFLNTSSTGYEYTNSSTLSSGSKQNYSSSFSSSTTFHLSSSSSKREPISSSYSGVSSSTSSLSATIPKSTNGTQASKTSQSTMISSKSGARSTSSSSSSTPTSTLSTNTPTGSLSFIGSWADSTSITPVSFTFFDIPTTTFASAASETSEGVLLGGLFIALQANRKWLTDSTLRSQFLDDVEKTQEHTTALLNDLSVKPPDASDCHNTKRKRQGRMSERQLRALLKRDVIGGIGNVISGAAHDVAALVSCASDVMENLSEAVKSNTPDLGEIETLTDYLGEIGQDMEADGEDDDDDENKSSSADHSSQTVTSTSSHSSQSSQSSQSSSSSSSSRTSSSSASGTITDTPPSWTPDAIAAFDTDALNKLATQIAMLDSLVSKSFSYSKAIFPIKHELGAVSRAHMECQSARQLLVPS